MKNFFVVIFIWAIIFSFSNKLFAQEMGPQAQATVAEVPQQSGLLQQLAAQAQQMQQKQAQIRKAPVTARPGVDTRTASATKEAVNSGAAPSASANVSAAGVYDEAFSGVVNQMLPMSPEQISRLRSIFNESQKAAAMPVGIPPRPVTSSVLVNLSPQATPPIIRLGAGYISSLVFMDSTGQPWPIQSYSIGDPTAFNIQWDKKGNTLLIQASSLYKRSNLAVILNGLDTPVMLTLLSGQEVIDYRVDLRVPGLGPNAAFAQNGLPDSANPILLDVLNGIPPKGSRTLKVSGGDCQAWLLNNRLFLRTNLDVISPAWKSVMSSADGTHAYELQPAPVVLALQRGKDKTLILTLEGFE
jgi:intracellular multiplication protein IcmK